MRRKLPPYTVPPYTATDERPSHSIGAVHRRAPDAAFSAYTFPSAPTKKTAPSQNAGEESVSLACGGEPDKDRYPPVVNSQRSLPVRALTAIMRQSLAPMKAVPPATAGDEPSTFPVGYRHR